MLSYSDARGDSNGNLRHPVIEKQNLHLFKNSGGIVDLFCNNRDPAFQEMHLMQN